MVPLCGGGGGLVGVFHEGVTTSGLFGEYSGVMGLGGVCLGVLP